MRRLTAMFSSIALLVACGTTACERGGGGGGDEKAESKQAAKKKTKEKKTKKAEKDEKKEKSEVSKEDYVQASVQLACVDEYLGGNDEVDSKKVESDILGSFGMDQKAFVKAQNKYSGDEKLSKKVEKQLEECTKKDAKKYAGMMKADAGDDGDGSEGSDEGEKKEPAKPPATGKFDGTISGQSGFDQAKLTIRVENDFDTRFSFKGKREGKGFNISGTGKIDKNGDVDLSASSGKNEIELVGQVTSSKKEVNVKGKIWDKSFSANINVN